MLFDYANGELYPGVSRLSRAFHNSGPLQHISSEAQRLPSSVLLWYDCRYVAPEDETDPHTFPVSYGW